MPPRFLFATPLYEAQLDDAALLADLAHSIRMLASDDRAGQKWCREHGIGPSNVFGFNDPKGMCPNCNGLGSKLDVDLEKFMDTSKSLNEGPILFPDYAVEGWYWSQLISTGMFDPDKKLSKYSKKEMDDLLHSGPIKIKTKVGAKDFNMTFEGIVTRFTNKYIKGDLKTKSERTQKMVEPYMTMGPCTLCHGARLSQEVLKCKINGYNIADLTSMDIPVIFSE